MRNFLLLNNPIILILILFLLSLFPGILYMKISALQGRFNLDGEIKEHLCNCNYLGYSLETLFQGAMDHLLQVQLVENIVFW